MLLGIIRWLRGYVSFSMSGKHPERFLNIINIRGIRLWDFVPCEKGHKGKMFLSDYLAVRPLARGASVRLRSEKRVGLPFFIKKYRRRKGLLFGAVAAALILTVMSLFVWDIRISGADGMSETELRSAFDDCGFKVGMLKWDFDSESIERQVELKVPEVKWLSINMLNNVAEVEVQPLSKRPRMSVGTYPCNIKASSDGVITDIVVKNGTCEVKRGSAVASGQLLVNSVVPIGEDRQKYVHSEARIMADVIDEESFKIPLKKNSLILNSNYTEKTNLNFLCLSLPFTLSPSSGGIEVCRTFTEVLKLNDTCLPLGRLTRRSYYFSESEIKLGKARAMKLLRTRAALRECFREGKSTVKKRTLKLLMDENGYTLKVNYVFNKDVALKQRIRITKR